MINGNIRGAYNHYRRNGYSPLVAIQRARHGETLGTKYFDTSRDKPRAYNPRHSDLPSYKHLRWIEDTNRAGLRFVKYADEIVSLRHSGWYASPDNISGEIYRGAVWQLPARNGKPFFAYGYFDPNNDDAALICFDNDATDESDAARFADQLAETMADQERAYNEAWQAGSRFSDLGDQLAAIRATLLNALRERRALVGTDAPSLCALLRDKVRDLLEEREELTGKRAELLRDYGREDAFLDGAGWA